MIRNHGDGIVIRGPMATDNVVQGNEVGASFNLSAGNFSNGIVIDGAPSNTIGGIQAGEANYIGANRDGIVIRGAAAKYNTVLGNHVGRYPSGASTAPNTGWGIYVDGGSFNKIGSTDAGGANDVLLSGAGGVLVRGATANGNQVSGNLIGTTKGDAVNAGNNGPGVRLDTGANQNQVHSNIIGYNHGNGIEVVGNNSIGNSLRFNSLRVNDKLGIDLGANGVTLNDATDLDNGPNQYQNFPVLKTAQFANEILTVTGTLTSIPNLKYAIDFYGDPGIDPTGYGEGRFYLGTVEVTTDGAGFAAISANLGALATGKYISATATPLSRGTPSTSELAKSIQIAGVNAALAAPQLVSPLSRDTAATASSNLSNGLRAEGEGTAASDSKLVSVVAGASSRNSAPNAASQLETLLAAAHRNDPKDADAALRDLFADML